MRPWLCLVLLTVPLCAAQRPWHFVVSGDSRNCGDVVMPAIAKAANSEGAQFYWHLGDFRAIYTFDEDYVAQHPLGQSPRITDYLAQAWPDFIQNQIQPFGNLPVFLAIGNHELIPPKTREQIIIQFADWLNSPTIREQRLRDDPKDHVVRTWYHWIDDGVDFITLDNATPDEFDSTQLPWLERILARDKTDPSIRAVVVGMHEALPNNLGGAHSMDQSAQGVQSGREAYTHLLDVHKTKPVYVLASHSHYFMEGIFNTDYWRTHGGVLPGWIVGTAGAVRYSLPAEAVDAKQAKTHVYGYLLATVTDSVEDPVQFSFHELNESDVPQDVVARFTSSFVHQCWSANPPQH
jgi:hypothetical protein